jgi:hypothetical protein
VLDGELVALDEDRGPDFPLICECLLQRRFHTFLIYMVFEVLSIGGEAMTSQPYAQRRVVVEDLALDGPQWRPPQTLMTAKRYGQRYASTNWRASSRRSARAVTSLASADGSSEEAQLLALGDGTRRNAAVAPVRQFV